MQDKKQKTYQSSYRKQLIQLAKFYGIVEIKKLLKDQKYLKSVLKEGNLKANTIANNKLNKIYNEIGILNIG